MDYPRLDVAYTGVPAEGGYGMHKF